MLEVGLAERLAATLPRATEIIRSQRIITAALLGARRREEKMALADKASHLADRIKNIPATFESAMDVQLARLDTLEQRGANVAKRFTTHVDDLEGAITTTENAVTLMSNGGPA